jgi:hypothetical protein
MSSEALELRVLMSGRNGSELFEMRCDVREATARYLASQTPDALNRSRVTVEPMETA